jgi:hypothetical protein
MFDENVYLVRRAITLGIIAWLLPVAGAVVFVFSGGRFRGGPPENSDMMGVMIVLPGYLAILFAVAGFHAASSASLQPWSDSKYKQLKTIALWLNGLYFMPLILLWIVSTLL